jgi:preprotein translocase subunit SecG
MTTLITAIHVSVCILLVLIVLLQSGKGAEMGVSIGGGGSQTLFGASGPATLLTKITTGVAIVFMLTSLTLAYFSGHKAEKSIITANPAPVQQAAEPASE